MEKIIFSFIMCIMFSLSSYAQCTSTYYSDKWGYLKSNVEDVVYNVEDMSSEEIKLYNSLKNAYITNNEEEKNMFALELINRGRAYRNLLVAPPIILDWDFFENENGKCFNIYLMNTTPKTIKEITFIFSFENNGTKVYDIKTGSETCILKFNNLCGRPNCKTYTELYDSDLSKCFHILEFEDASYIKQFFNKKANESILEKIIIKFNDGSTTNNIARFKTYNDYNGEESFLQNGPLSPLFKFINLWNLKYGDGGKIMTD